MQTALADFIRDTPEGREADRILRACVHCGFCTATCPTYQLLGDELDGPRGRIYQIKGLLEGAPATPGIQVHLDRCLTCLSCESTCPSGVCYGRLLEIGRRQLERRLERPFLQRWTRRALRWVLPEPRRFAVLARLGRLARPLLGARLRSKLPAVAKATPLPRPGGHPRRMLLLDGCVQPLLAPEINGAAVRVLDRLGIRLEAAPGAGCCGAVRLHLADREGARTQARSNIDAWWPAIAAGAEALIASSSACALMLKEYGGLLADDPEYADKARRVAELARDLVEVLAGEEPERLAHPRPHSVPVAFHAPCTLQHGQRLNGAVEQLLGRLGMELTPVSEAHLCCGSAGTYSLLQAELSEQLKERKLQALQGGEPGLIATANIGCLLQLRNGARVPVVHWIQLLDGADIGKVRK
jgi:glycolate oxidase iron-sulfur subunit